MRQKCRFMRFIMETKIELLKPLYINGEISQAGQTLAVNELHARELIKKGYAILADDAIEQAKNKEVSQESEESPKPKKSSKK